MNDQRRRVVSTILGVAGAVLLLIGGFALYARQEFFNSDNFSQTAAQSLREEPVRDALARPIVDQIITLGPDQLINVQPLLEGAVSGVLETNAFKSVFQEAVRKAHKAVFSKDRDQLILTIQDANAVIVGAVRAVNPQVAKKIPEDVGQRLVRVTNSKVALTAARWADQARFLGLLLPPLGILLLAGSVWLAPERRRALVNCLMGVAAAGAVGFIALLVVRTLLLRRFQDETTHDAVAAVYDAYMGGLANWMLLGGVLAVALAAAAATRDPQPLERPRRVLAWFGRAPDSTWARVVRALLVGIARHPRLPRADPGGPDHRRAGRGGGDLLRRGRADRGDRARREGPGEGQGGAQAASTGSELADAGARGGDHRRGRRGGRVRDHRRGQARGETARRLRQELQRLRAAVRPHPR